MRQMMSLSVHVGEEEGHGPTHPEGEGSDFIGQ
jgi:hypothetical protein